MATIHTTAIWPIYQQAQIRNCLRLPPQRISITTKSYVRRFLMTWNYTHHPFRQCASVLSRESLRQRCPKSRRILKRPCYRCDPIRWASPLRLYNCTGQSDKRGRYLCDNIVALLIIAVHTSLCGLFGSAGFHVQWKPISSVV